MVAACLAAGTHHLDISGEPQFLETMQLEHHTEAEAAGVYVIGSCGFDSIPADLGAMVLAEAMDGDVATIETYLRVVVPDIPGPSINFATWQSAIHGFAHASELVGVRAKQYPERLPRLAPRLAPRANLHRSPLVGSWCLPFPGSDKSVMYRSQRCLFHRDGARPAQVQCYVQLASLSSALLTIAVGAVFGLLAKTRCGRGILGKSPPVLPVTHPRREAPGGLFPGRGEPGGGAPGQGRQHRLRAAAGGAWVAGPGGGRGARGGAGEDGHHHRQGEEHR